MKLYIVDNTRKLKKIRKHLEDEVNIEIKENLKFKMTKNDYVLLSDEVGTLEDLDKLKNIIILVKEKTRQYIWNLANNYKTVDIIDNAQTEEYIANRIKQVIRREE